MFNPFSIEEVWRGVFWMCLFKAFLVQCHMQKNVLNIVFNNVYLNFFQLNHDLLVKLIATEIKFSWIKIDSNSILCIWVQLLHSIQLNEIEIQFKLHYNVVHASISHINKLVSRTLRTFRNLSFSTRIFVFFFLL